VRHLKEQADDPNGENGSTDWSQSDPPLFEISSDWRLGIDRGKSGNAVVTSLASRGLRTIKDLMF